MTVIQEARELVAKCFAEYSEEIPQMEICRGFSLLPALISEAEIWRAIAIAERVLRSEEGGWKRSSQEAASELALEAPDWKKIGPEEQAALNQVLDVLDHFPRSNELYDACKTLRKLLEGKG
jgi:hypothetical protein